MFEDFRRKQALKRVKPGDGRGLQQFRWWHTLRRSLFTIELEGRAYTIDVRHGRKNWTEDGRGIADLYVDGRHQAESRLPAAFPVPGGTIDVAESAFGLKRCEHVGTDGSVTRLTPDPSSAEGRRARLDRRHPTMSRSIGAVSILVLLVPLTLLVMQVAESISEVPPLAERFGTFTSPVDLSVWANVGLGLVAAVASTERALRLRNNAILDSVG